jgi:hypothetical protein
MRLIQALGRFGGVSEGMRYTVAIGSYSDRSEMVPRAVPVLKGRGSLSRSWKTVVEDPFDVGSLINVDGAIATEADHACESQMHF